MFGGICKWQGGYRRTKLGAKRLRAHQPLDCCALFQLCRKVFYASRLNLCGRIDLTFFLGKRNLKF